MKNLSDFENKNINCSKCSGNMEKGFIADYTYGSSDSTIVQNRWVEGEYKTNWTGAAKLKDQKKFIMTTFRCVNCGYLESFAVEEKS